MMRAYLMVVIPPHLYICAKTFISLNLIFTFSFLSSIARVSWKLTYIIASVMREIIAQRIAVPRKEIENHTESDPSAGPTKRDIPNTAPFIPNTFDRSS
jgi:hypothetical protein